MRKLIRIIILEDRGGELYIAGSIPNYSAGSERFFVEDEGGSRAELIVKRAPAMDREASEGKKAQTGYVFETSLPLRNGAAYRFICVSEGREAVLPPHYGRFSRLLNIDGSFFRAGGLIVRSARDGISVSADSTLLRMKLSHHLDRELKKEAPTEIMKLRREAAALKQSGKPLWLISDRSDSASDNGEALFDYLINNKDDTGIRERCDLRFVISPESPDYERMKQAGPVVDAGSYEHKLLFLASSLVISSSGDEWIRNPLGADLKYCRDLAEARFIFLQHGVIMNDLSSWLYKLKKNISLFMTTAHGEYESICSESYGYDESVVRLTGLARYDRLHNDPEKLISFLPTWRKSLAPPIIPGSSARPYSEEFRDSDYFRFYDRLINDPAIISAMNENGYRGVFYMHPSHMNQWRDFEGNDTISVWNGLVPFSEVFNRSALLVTDYSSVAIDFAYLRKPVVYTQFDRDSFFEDQIYERGYFDYERDGFGPVCPDYESAVSAIIDMIKNDCREPETYLERTEKFFAYSDSSNCRRIYEELIKL